jgi:hypothetical protein
MKKRHQQKLIVLAIILLCLLNIPIILIFNSAISVIGIPVIYLYIFFVWVFSIVSSYIILKKYYE